MESQSAHKTKQSSEVASVRPAISTFKISFLIRLTLSCLYAALTIPLPFLLEIAGPDISPQLLWLFIGLGGIALHGALSERVTLDDEGIKVSYPSWVPRLFRRGWALPWSEVKALKPRTTGQGGLVYYFLSQSGQGYLLPMRVAGFSRLVREVQTRTGIDTSDVRPLSQPWMYFILLGCTLILLLIDFWTIWMIVGQNY